MREERERKKEERKITVDHNQENNLKTVYPYLEKTLIIIMIELGEPFNNEQLYHTLKQYCRSFLLNYRLDGWRAFPAHIDWKNV